jgi:ankyrin repeat protein/WD40 repeat protein
MESLRHEVEAKFPELAGRLGGFAALEDPLRRAKATYAEAMRGVSGLDKLEAYKERRDPNLKQDEGDFETLYAQAAVAQKILVESLRKLRDDVKDPGVKGRPRSLQKLANDYGGDARYLKDLSRATILCETPDELLDVLNRLTSVGLEIAQVKNKFASPTPMGYRDFNLNVRVPLDDGSTHIAEFQVNLNCVLAAKKIAHKQYEVIRAALPAMCMDTSVEAEALEAFISERLNSSALDAAVGALERKADGLMLYARLIADQLEATTGKIDFASVGALPAGLDEIYAENFRRVFVDDASWVDALPLVELICAAAEPLTIDAASGALGWDRARCKKVCDGVSLLFPLREGDIIGVLHKTVTDWLTGEAPFDKRSSEDAFFVARDAAHRRLARACARAIRAGVLDTESHASDAAADELLASFVEGEGGLASDAYALRWCLFHMKRSCSEGEAVAVACSLAYVQKRSAGDIVSFVADLNVLQGQDTLLLSDGLVLSRNALSLGVPLVEQLWQRMMPRADAESSPAARRLAEDAKRAASRLSLSTVRPMGLMAAGGAERCRFEVEASCLATFVDPATGEPRVACACDEENFVCIYDPVAGGAALVVIGVLGVRSEVKALAVFKDPATGQLRLVCGTSKDRGRRGDVRVFDPIAGGDPLLVVEVGEVVRALAVFTDPATGAPRLACGGYDKKVRVFDPVAGGEALVVLDLGDTVRALAVFTDPATGEPRLACASGRKVLVFDPVVGGEALLVLDVDSDVNALAAFEDPATSAPRLACGCVDGKVRVFDAVSGGDPLLVLVACNMVYAVVAFEDLATGAPWLASGSVGKVHVFDPVAGGNALVVLEGHTREVCALTAFTDPATGESRLVSGSWDGTVRVWNPAAGGAAIEAEPERHSQNVEALVTFVDPSTGALRVATGSGDKTIRVWDAETGGALLVLDVGSRVLALAFFVDPATGAPRLVTSSGKIFDPVAGGNALLELDVRGGALAFFTDPATGAPRLACGCRHEVRVVDPVVGGEALVVIKVGSEVYALAVFADPATGELRVACGCDYGKVRIFDPAAGGEALVVLEGHMDSVWALTVFEDQVTGALRLASGSRYGGVRIWDLAAGGAALFVLEGHTDDVEALTAFADPATGETRLVSGSGDKTLRVWDASKGGAALQVVAFDDKVKTLAVGRDTSGLFVALGKRWGELRIEGGTTPLTLTCYKGDLNTMSALLQQGAGVDQEDYDGYTPLFVASLKGHVNVARVLLDAGAAVDKRREGDWSPFGIACARGHLDVAKMLLDRGAAVDLCLDGATPLLFACRNQNLDTMRFCLERGADVNCADKKGNTVLYDACEHGQVDAARLLLDNGAEVDRATEDGRTPLYIACDKGHVDAGRLLLDKGAEVDRADEDGRTPLLTACYGGHVDVARLLLAHGAEVDRATEDDWTPLQSACCNGHVDAARLLLDKGAEVDRARGNGCTPLYIACEKGHVDAARLLLDKGAGVDRADKRGRTPLDIAKRNDHDAVVALLEEHLDSKFPLHAAARTGDVEAMTPLLDGGAEVDAKKDGATPLIIACEEGHVDAARLLLDKGAEVDRARKDGATPLSIACQNGHVDAARLLLERGAVFEHDSSALCEGDAVKVRYRGREKYYPGKIRRDRGEGKYDIAYDDGERETRVEARFIRKLSLLAIAKENGHAAVVALLEEHMDLKFPLHAAARTGDVDAMTQLIDGGAEVDANKDGATPLFVACEGGHVDAARLLLDKGAEVDRASEKGLTPLFLACQKGNDDAVRLLLEKGAEVNQAVEGGWTPLLIATHSGHSSMVMVLLERGAEVDQAVSGWTSLFIACKNGNVEAARLLLEAGAEIDRAMENGATPLSIASDKGHSSIVALLEEHLDSKFPLHAAAKTGDVEAMTQLLDGGAEVDAKKDGRTPLFVACEGGHVDAARLLLERGAVLDHDSSALCEGDAVEARYQEGRKYYPGKISRDCGEGKYDIAYDDGDKETGVVARLIRRLPRSPLDIAQENGHAAVVALLKERQK